MYFLYKTKSTDFFHAVETLYEEEILAAVPEGRKDLLQYLNYTISNFDKDKKALITQKWIQPVSETPRWVIPLIIIVLAVFIAAFIITYIFYS